MLLKAAIEGVRHYTISVKARAYSSYFFFKLSKEHAHHNEEGGHICDFAISDVAVVKAGMQLR